MQLKDFLKKLILPGIFLALAGGAIGLGTWKDLNEQQPRFIWDMAFSPAYASQSPNPVFPDGETEQNPVPGTVARGYPPFPYPPGEAGRHEAGEALKNPYQATPENLSRGRFIYTAYCLPCHGPEGRGDGSVAKIAPPLGFDNAGEYGASLKDGEIYHVIMYGNNQMPSYASQLLEADRWKVILYLRQLQAKRAKERPASESW